MKEKKRTHRKWVLPVVLLEIGNLVFFLTVWFNNQYNNIALDQILFQLKAPIGGSNSTLILNAVVQVGLYSVLASAACILLFFLLSGKIKVLHQIRFYAKYALSSFCRFMEKTALPISLAVAVCATAFLCVRLKIVSYIVSTGTESDFIESNYVTPDSELLSFPEKKRNLIYLVLESMEATYTDKADGGFEETDYIPELTALAKENVSFSNTGTLGGALSYDGTTWTSAALVAQTAGVIIKVPIEANKSKYGSSDTFVPGVVSIGELLENEGYNQTLMVGSDSGFGGRKAYFTEHGNYTVVDELSLKAEGRLPKDYHEWWGYEDSKLFGFAKEEITALAAKDEPFNFTLLTADTHFPDGYLCSLCENTHHEQYGNVLSCSSRQVAAFVDWIKTQPFYENTTIVISGDHLTMDSGFLKKVDSSYVRTVYNCFINSAVKPIEQKNRLFGTFDLFPTTLAAMGVNIQGGQLGLGVNLFSTTPTLTEQYGFDALNTELQKKSIFYNEAFLEMSDQTLAAVFKKKN